MKTVLMHRDAPVLSCEMEKGVIRRVYEVFDASQAPVGSFRKTGVNLRDLMGWWEMRTVPDSRDWIESALPRLGAESVLELAGYAHGLSVTDSYWIRAEGEESLRWDDINFFTHDFRPDAGKVLIREYEADWERWWQNSSGRRAGDVPGADEKTRQRFSSPDLTTNGWLRKCWIRKNGKLVLVKAGSRPYYQEPLCEAVATELCRRWKIRHVEYEVAFGADGRPYSLCENQVTGDTEFVPAWFFFNLKKRKNSDSDYMHYLKTGEEYGIPDMEAEMERMFCVDYVCGNTDRHWTNFGVIRETGSLTFKETFPVFDVGTSLFTGVDTADIGRDPVNGRMLRGTLEHHMEYLRHAPDLSIEALSDFPEWAESTFRQSKTISDRRAARIREELSGRIRKLDRILAEKRVSVPVSGGFGEGERGDRIASWSPRRRKG